jgi:hypothetical protein
VTIRANHLGLTAFANNCGEQTDAVGNVFTAAGVGPSFQATAAAVAATTADVAVTQALFAERMQSTADDVVSAAQAYAVTEANSAAALTAMSTAEV